MLFGGPEKDRPDALAHAPLGDHQPCKAGCLLEVLGGAGARVVVDQSLGRPATHQRVKPGLDLALVVAHPVFFGHDTASRPARGRGG